MMPLLHRRREAVAKVGYALMWATLAPVVASADHCSLSFMRSTGAAFAPALPLPGFTMAKGWGWLPCSSSKQSGAAVSSVGWKRSLWDGALGLEATGKEGQKKESKRRRMFRIAELRREMTADVQRWRQRVKDKLMQRGKASQASLDDESGLSAHIKGSFSKQEVTKEMKEKTSMGADKKQRRPRGTIHKVRDAEQVLGPLLKERRTSYERRRKMGSAGSSDDGDADDSGKKRQWGPRQMIYCPPEMRLTQEISERAQRIQPTRNFHQLMQGSRNASLAGYEKSNGKEQTEQQNDGKNTIFICRHGDRFNPDWNVNLESALDEQMADNDVCVCQIIYNQLGHHNIVRQAADLGEYLASQGVKTIISSPYLRCLQTAQQVAWATGAKILVEPGLAEGPGHELGWLPDMLERYRYLSEIDMAYRPLTTEPSREMDDMLVIPRCQEVARVLSPRLLASARSGGVAVVTHASVAIALTATLSVCGGKMLRDQVLQMLRVGDDWSYSESDMSEFSDMPEKGGYEDAHVSKERDDTKIMQTTVLRQDEGIENDDQQLSQILEQIDSARPGGAYKLAWSDEKGKWETELDCLTHFQDDSTRTGSRTPAWRFTFPNADKK